MESLIFKVLGTSASSAIPEYFCSCPVCTYARTHGGKDIRSRTGYAIGQTVRFDFGPDAQMQNHRFGLRGDLLEHLFFTHSHIDHFFIDNFDKLEYRAHPLNIYGNAEVLRRLVEYPSAEFMNLHELHPGDVTEIPELQLKILALEADHIPTEQALLYRIEHGENRVLIAHDTNIFPESTFRMLAGKVCRHIFMDCTWGDLDRGFGHMGLPNNLAVLERLKELGAADEQTCLHPTHLGHRYGAMIHEKWLYPAAYDGMELEL